jgi:protein-tyrosine phosphatase
VAGDGIVGRGRWVELDGCVNLRDLGGYEGLEGATVRTGAVYRSDALGRVTPEELVRALGELGVRTTIDLRGDDERARQGQVGDAVPGRHLHIPAIDRTAHATAASLEPSVDIGELYLAMLVRGRDAFRRCLEVIADADGHAVAFYCSAGKDRTGILAALVLGLVGVASDDIVADYALTETVADLIEARAIGENPDIVAKVWSRLPPGVSRAWPASMARFLELVDAEFAGFEALAGELGVDSRTVDRLRSALLT